MDHYVVITEYLEDDFDGKDKFVVASWGGKLVIEADQLRSGLLGGNYFVDFTPNVA